ncbi:MAG: bifunctional DNA primase/polymerase [Aggregatilineales bacterium]
MNAPAFSPAQTQRQGLPDVDASRVRAREARSTARIVARPKDCLPNPAALYAQGFSIFPLLEKDKKPALSSWKQFQERRATLIELFQWREQFPRANYGVVTGEVSGIFVIDADDLDIADHWHNRLPDTKEVSTGRGVHFYLKLPPGVTIANTTHKGDGWDVRGNGGYVVGEGSVHPSGAIYTSNGLPIANAPDWLIAELQKPKGNHVIAFDNRPAPRPLTMNGSQSSDYERAQAACETISASRLSDYDTWLRIGMALHALGSAGLPLWDTLSARDTGNYKPGECERKWATFGKRSGVNLATLFYHADQDDPTWRKRFAERQHAAQPAERKVFSTGGNSETVIDNPQRCGFAESAKKVDAPLATVASQPTPESDPTAGAMGWPVELPNTVERAILAWLKTSAAIYLRALLLGIRAGTVNPEGFTLAAIAETAGVELRTLRNGLSGVLDIFIANAPDQIELLPKLHTIDRSIGGTDNTAENPMCDFGNNSQGGRPWAVYRLLPFDQAVANLLERVILPRLAEKHFTDRPEAAPTITALLRTLDCADPAVVSEVKAIIDQSASTPAHKQLRQDYAQWRIDLADRTYAFLEGDWTTTPGYRAAVVARDLLGKQVTRVRSEAITGLSARRIDAVLPLIEAVKEDRFETVDCAPGKPVRKVIKGGFIRRLDAHWPGENRTASAPVDQDNLDAANKWVADKMQSGAQVVAVYQVASLYRPATDQELQQADRQRVRIEAAKAQAAKEQAEREPLPTSTPPPDGQTQRPVEYRGLDHSPAFARKWLASMERLYGFTICDGRLVRLADDVRQALAPITHELMTYTPAENRSPAAPPPRKVKAWMNVNTGVIRYEEAAR